MTTITEKIEAIGSAKLLGTFPNNSPEWHEARAGLGGSDAGTVAGLNPWKSAYTLWCEKTGRVQGITEPSMAMTLGTIFEQPIKQLWAERNQDWLKVHDTGTWVSTNHPDYKANPDGIIEWHDGQLGVLEIKFSRNPMTELPPHYEAQVLWYLHTLGLKRGVLVAVANGDLVEFPIDYHPERMLAILEAADRFQWHIEHDLMPEWDGSDSTLQTVREQHPDIIDGEIELGELWLDALDARIKFLEAESNFNRYKSAIMDHMAGIKTGLFRGEVVIKLQARKNGLPFIAFK